MRNLKTCLMASAAVACIGAATPAHAQFAFGAGATFPSIVYRQLMDCVGLQAQGDAGAGPLSGTPLPIAPACPSFPFGDASDQFEQILYAPTGSGNGKTAFLSNDPNTITVPSAANRVPYTDARVSGFPYPWVTFAGSDDVITTGDMTTWNTAFPGTDPRPGFAGQTRQQLFGNLI